MAASVSRFCAICGAYVSGRYSVWAVDCLCEMPLRSVVPPHQPSVPPTHIEQTVSRLMYVCYVCSHQFETRTTLRGPEVAS